MKRTIIAKIKIVLDDSNSDYEAANINTDAMIIVQDFMQDAVVQNEEISSIIIESDTKES